MYSIERFVQNLRKLGVWDLNALWHAGFQLHEQSFLYFYKMNQFKVFNQIKVFNLVIHQLNYMNKLFIETHTDPPSLWLLDQSLSLNLAQFNVVAYVGQLKIFQTFGWHENQIFLNSNFTRWSQGDHWICCRVKFSVVAGPLKV